MTDILLSPERARVSHETERYLEIYNDTTTWLAETLNGEMSTTFDFEFNGTDLISEEGRSMRKFLEDGLTDVDEIVVSQPELAFLKPLRQEEMQEHSLICAMARGELPNTMVLISEFPQQLKTASKNISGYNVKRQQDIMRLVMKLPSGKIRMISQTLDNTTPASVEAIYSELDFNVDPSKSYLSQRAFMDLDEKSQAALPNRLVNTFDHTLSREYGGQWHAGRRGEDRKNTYDFVLKQQDLVDDFVQRWLVGGVDEDEMYNLAAAIEKRFGGDFSYSNSGMGPSSESTAAGLDARVEGKSYDGCGLSLTANNSSKTAFEMLGYGNKIKKMHCPFCGASKWGDPCASHLKCNGCKAEVKDGKIVNEGNFQKKRKLGKKAVGFWQWFSNKAKR